MVKVYPERVLVAQGSPVTLRCQVTGPPPHYYYWSREDGRPVTNSAIRQRQGIVYWTDQFWVIGSMTWPSIRAIHTLLLYIAAQYTLLTKDQYW